MKKSVIAKILVCIMFPAFFLLGGCDFNSDDIPKNAQLDQMQENLDKDPDFYKKFTYTYYNSDGKKLTTSAFQEAYVFVDPGKDGRYDDRKTGRVVGFAELSNREMSVLAQDIAYKLLSVYGGLGLEESQNIEEKIKNIETGEIYNSNFKVVNNKKDSLGIFEDADKTKYNNDKASKKYNLDDYFTLSLLSANKSEVDSIADENWASISKMFVFEDAINGAGQGIIFDETTNQMIVSTIKDTSRAWQSVTAGANGLEALSTLIENKIRLIKTGGTNDVFVIDHLGFTSSEINDIKKTVLNEIIGANNVNLDESAKSDLIKNSNDVVANQGVFVTLNDDGTIKSSSAYSTKLQEYIAGTGISLEQFKNLPEFKSYANMFSYKAYTDVVDKIVDLALISAEYDGDELVDDEENPLYFLYPRISVMIVPGAYLGGESEDVEENEDGDYDFDEIADKSEFNENYDPKTTMEPYLPSWKIISIVYKPDEVYGINQVTNDRIDGVIVPDIDIAFVGEKGYVSLIESHISYYANGHNRVDPSTTMVSDILQEDVCPDMTASDYPDNHYLSIFDITKLDKDQLSDYVLKKYDGFDFVEKAGESGSRMTITRVGTTDSTVYFSRVDGLPYLHSFMKYNEDANGNLLLDMSCLGSSYVKLDINFLNIKNNNNEDVTNSVKRTNIGIISIEPHTAG